MKEKISGILNNCALNTALPVMLKDFEILAKLETENQLPKLENLGVDGAEEKSEIRGYDDVYLSYHKLKEIFAITYGVNELTWQKLVNFLQSFESFLAIQIIFLPVSRKFISEIAKNKNYTDLHLLSSIQKAHEIKHEDNCTGKYNPLCGKEAWELFHSQFGIPITITINRPLRKLADSCEIRHQAGEENQSVHLVHEDSSTALMPNFAEAVEFPNRSNEKETEEYDDCNIPPWGFKNRKVNLFYNNKHFEIWENPDDISDEINNLEKKHAELYKIFLNLSNTNSDQKTNIYLKKLQKYVRKELKNNRPLRKLADSCEIRHQAGAENQSVHPVHEDSSTALMPNFAESVKFPKRSNHNEVGTTNSKYQNHKFYGSNLYMIFNSMHFKLLILYIMIIALLLIIALILGSSGADKLIPTFLNDLAPKVYNTILGTSIAAGSVSITFFTSLLLNKENNDPSNIQKNGMHPG